MMLVVRCSRIPRFVIRKFRRQSGGEIAVRTASYQPLTMQHTATAGPYLEGVTAGPQYIILHSTEQVPGRKDSHALQALVHIRPAEPSPAPTLSQRLYE